MEETNNFLEEKIKKIENLNKTDINKENNNQLKIISESNCKDLTNSARSSLYQISIRSLNSSEIENLTIKNSHLSSVRYQLPYEIMKSKESYKDENISESNNSKIFVSDLNLNNFFEEISNSINNINKKDLNRFKKVGDNLNDIYFTDQIQLMNVKREIIKIPKLDIEIKRDISEERFLIKNNIRVIKIIYF